MRRPVAEMHNDICPVCGGELPASTDPDTTSHTALPATRRPGEPCICNEEIRIPGDSLDTDPTEPNS